MSERLEQWKARERFRSDIGWVAVWIGILGVLCVCVSVARVAFLDERLNSNEIREPGPWWAPWAGIFQGAVLLVCARGLWNARGWARWTTLLISAAFIAIEVVAYATERTMDFTVLFYLYAVVYLLLPSTAARFARAAGRATA